jgi:ligand-binding sensor domain-containing protein/two-component sensor histidine kinase
MLLFMSTLLLFFIAKGQKKIHVKLNKVSQQVGLTSYNIKKTIQDKKGFVWIATQEGLSRYDSKTVKSFKEGPEKFNISGNDIWDIKEDTVNNLIWVAAYNSLDGIDIITGKIRCRVKGELTKTWIKCILLDKDKIWIGTFNGLFVFEITSGKLNRIPLQFSKDFVNGKFNISSIFKDKLKRIWMFSPDYGLVILNPAGLKTLKTMSLKDLHFKQQQDFRYSNNLIQMKSGQILLGASEGFRIFSLLKNDSIECRKAFLELTINEPVSAFSFDLADNLWFATTKGLYKYDKTKEQVFIIEDDDKSDDENWFNAVFDIRIDSDNTLWLSTQKGLAYLKLGEKPLSSFYKSVDLKHRIKHVYFIYPEDAINLLVCAEDGFYRINSETKKMKQISVKGSFFYAFKAYDGTVIVSSQNQMYYLDGDKLEKIEKKYTELSFISKESINSDLFLGDSVIAMGSESIKGVFLWNYQKRSLSIINSTTGKEKLASDIVNYITNTKGGEIAILSDSYLSTVNVKDRTVNNYSIKEKGSNEGLTFLFDLKSVAQKYYLGVYGKGIYCLNDKFEVEKKYSEANGLSNNGVYKLFNVGDSSLYITTNNGLSILDINTQKIKNYYQSDGLHSNAFEEACGIMKGGLIYAGGVNGFTMIDPSKFTFNKKAPKIYINRIFVEAKTGNTDTANFELKRLTIPNNVLQTTIYLSGINWSNPERTSFSWRITERSEEWINIGPQNFIPLIGLEHGTYHLQVKAANEDGVWSEPKELVLIFLPKWYQTWWFKLLVFLTTAAIIYAFYRYRIRQIKKQHEIRKNIATDLHDDLGSTLNSVKVFTNLAISGVKQEESLQQVKDNLTEATMSLRDMIWVLDDSLDTVDELITRLKQFAIPVAGASNIEAIIKADSEVNNRQLSKEEKRNLFLICKEAINNSIKYAGASQIEVDITASGKKIQIVIADNGKGFNVDEVKKGYGLKNMQYRAGQIKYEVILNSALNEGTQIIIQPK